MTELLASYLKVLTLFVIPIGGGIPGGVLLAKKFGIPWPITSIIYFLSDVILACVFEPLMLIFIHFAKKSHRLTLARETYLKRMQQNIKNYGLNLGPFTLVLISFGVDPMTGRAAAKASGYNYLMGWMFAIAGDMVFFFVLMISTLWLNGILGDGTLTMIIILGLMFTLPKLIARFRNPRSLI